MEKTNFLNKTRQQGGKKLHFLKFLPQERKIKLLFFSFQELLLPTPRNYHHCQKVDLRNYFLRRSGIKASGPPIASILTGLQAAKDFLDYEGGQSGKRIFGGCLGCLGEEYLLFRSKCPYFWGVCFGELTTTVQKKVLEGGLWGVL